MSETHRLEAKNLRIGNLILFEQNSTNFIVKTISEQGLDVYNDLESTWIEMNQFGGIPLTSEWFIRLGFKINKPLGENAFNCDVTKGNIEINRNITNSHAWVYRPAEKTPFVFIQYVHQLQNLYFALTGTELECAP